MPFKALNWEWAGPVSQVDNLETIDCSRGDVATCLKAEMSCYKVWLLADYNISVLRMQALTKSTNFDHLNYYLSFRSIRVLSCPTNQTECKLTGFENQRADFVTLLLMQPRSNIHPVQLLDLLQLTFNVPMVLCSLFNECSRTRCTSMKCGTIWCLFHCVWFVNRIHYAKTGHRVLYIPWILLFISTSHPLFNIYCW